MFDWPVKSEDINGIITNLEKELTKKEIEIKQQNQLISELITSLGEHRNKSREVKAKLGYVEEELKKLEIILEKSKLKLAFIDKEIEEIRNNVISKEHEVSYFNLENKTLKEKFNQIESQIKKLSFSSLDNILKEIRETLSYKGFLSKKEFEDLIKNMSIKE